MNLPLNYLKNAQAYDLPYPRKYLVGCKVPEFFRLPSEK